MSVFVFVNFTYAITAPTRNEVVLSGAKLDTEIANNKPQIQAPTKSTVFVNDKSANSEVYNSEDVYYSSNDPNFDIDTAKKNLKNIEN